MVLKLGTDNIIPESTSTFNYHHLNSEHVEKGASTCHKRAKGIRSSDESHAEAESPHHPAGAN